MNNTRFATALHILTLLSYSRDGWQTSDWIATSININPVIVRKELAVLNEAGLVLSRKGKEGGYKLGNVYSDITLGQIYQAVKNSDVLGKKNRNTNPACPVGNSINEKLESLFAEIDELVEKELSKKTLGAFTEQFH